MPMMLPVILFTCLIAQQTTAQDTTDVPASIENRLQEGHEQPTACLIEICMDGLMLTFDQPLQETSSQNTIAISLAVDPRETEILEAPFIQNVVRSPDGRRVFLHVPSLAVEPRLTLTVDRDTWPDPIVTRMDESTPRIDSEGPDFAASLHPAHSALDRTPPQGAIVLFDGTGMDEFIGRLDGKPSEWILERNELVVKAGTGDLVSRTPLSDGLYHIEWMSPPGGVRGTQLNGNSGIKIEERYELQILNTPARHDLVQEDDRPRDNEAGAIYRIHAPLVNASNGAGQWQSYHLWYTAPRWDDSGKTADARMTVYWNDVLVHDDVSIPSNTGASIEEGPDTRGLLLQDHASSTAQQVRYRNIWHVPAERLTQAQAPPGTTAIGPE